ncbi:MAG: amidohydrolase family protein [Bacteroidota bacterium]
MPKISASYIFDPIQGMLEDHYLEFEPDGKIVALAPLDRASRLDLKQYEGVLLPGFVNAHCHLELSFMKKQVPEGTGMTAFIGEVFSKRLSFTDTEKIEAVHEEMQSLWEAGTVAVGDICNTQHSLPAKIKYRDIFTHSFIELIGLDLGRIEPELNKGQALITEFETEGLQVSMSPHAPYSMSSELIREIFRQQPSRVSIHILESKEERELFENGSGPFLHFYRQLNLPYLGFSSKSPLDHVLQEMSHHQAVIFVHATEMTEEEIQRITHLFPQAYFCLCPRSNKYIHNTYPQVSSFTKFTNQICLGTDSLASNHDLNVFEEAKCVHKISPEVPLEELLNWLTLQGAIALGIDDRWGSFLVGQRPGINLIKDLDLLERQLREGSFVEKIC